MVREGGGRGGGKSRKGGILKDAGDEEVTADVVMPVGPVMGGGVHRGKAKEASKAEGGEGGGGGGGWGWGGTTGKSGAAREELAKKLTAAAFGEDDIKHPAKMAPSFLDTDQKRRHSIQEEDDDWKSKASERWEDRIEKDHKLLASGIENPKFYSARNGKKLKPSTLAPKFYSARNGDYSKPTSLSTLIRYYQSH